MANSNRSSAIWQLAYEILCFACVILLLQSIKSGGLVPLLIAPFLLAYLSNNVAATRIVFALVFSFLAFCTWIWIFTLCISNYLHDHVILEEHSWWDFFAFLIPVMLTTWTLVWALKRRTAKPKFEIAYISLLIAASLLVLALG